MSACIIVDIDIHDPAGYEEYKTLAHDTLAIHGGSYLARGGATEVLEGDWQPNRLVILEFDAVENAKAWLNSTEYAPARAIRQKTARANMIVVAGVS